MIAAVGQEATGIGQPAAPRPAMISLLGPQRLKTTVGAVADQLGLPRDTGIAAITAGWQESEAEDAELGERLGRPLVNLHLYRRAEHVFGRDRELTEAHRALQRDLKELRRLYNIRLAAAMDAVFQLLRERGDSPILERERQSAIEGLRALDTWHLRQIAEHRAEFAARWRPEGRAAVTHERAQIADLLAPLEAVVISGGHVAVLLNRLRLFGLDALLAGKTVLAWSAGAMVLSERIVLFHDSPPWGPGNAEVFESGLGFFPSLVALPHARRRLRLDDPIRVARFARRFAPARCAVLEAGSRLDWDGQRWTAPGGIDCLTELGGFEEVQQWS